MKIFVEKHERIFAFQFEQDEKIINAKFQIFKSVGININYFHLVYNDKIFDGDETLIEFGLPNKSLINIVRNETEILAKTEDGKNIEIYLHRLMKIIDIKCQIQDKIGLHRDEQKLIYQDEILDDDKMIVQYQICEKSVINIVDKSIIQIIIKTMHTERFVFFVNKMDKVIEIKNKIKEKTELHPEEQMLSYNGGILEDDKTFDSYLICDQSMLLLYEKQRKKIKLLFKSMNGKIIEILTENSVKIINLKYKVQEKTGLDIKNQVLIFEGETLSNDKTIDECRIIESSMINIVNKYGKPIQVFLKSVDREEFAITLSKSHKIFDVKRKIEEQISLDRDEQIYIYKGVILDNDKTIDECQISDQSMINIINKSKIEILINLELFDGRKFKLCAEKQTKIIEIKKQIETFISLDPIKQNLYYQGILLEGNENTLEEIHAFGKSEQFSIKTLFTSLLRPKTIQPSIIEMQISVKLSNDWLEIFVERPNQIQNKLCVFKSETIFDVKNKIHQIVNVEPDEQILYFNESILENNKTVEQSNIVEKSVLRVEFKLKNWINIYIKMWNGNRNMGKLDLMTTDKLGDLKLEIEEKIGINRDAQILMYNFEILLDDEKTVDQYQITNKSILDIKLRSEYTITCDEKEYEKMGNIKKIIRNRIQTNDGQKIILYSSNFNNNKLIFEFEIKDKEQKTVNIKLKKFIEAIKSGSIENVQMCYEKVFLEMKYGSYFRHPIHYACKYGLKDIVEYLIKEGCNLEATDSENRRPIHYVCAAGNVGLLNILLQHNINVEASDFLDRRPIHIACFNGNIDIVKILIENKCDKEACAYTNRRPIHYACLSGQVEIIEFLIGNNCDIESLDKSNRSPLMIAEENNSEMLIEILKKELETRRKIQIVAGVMELICIDDECDHEFCYTSFLSKKFIKNKQMNRENFGNVYHCKESLTGRDFIYKKFDNGSLSSKCMEGNINDFISTLRHERIIKYFGGFEIKLNKFVFMEFIESVSMKEKIKNQISTNNLVRFTKQLLEALGFLHENRIIHRNIKPDNIFVDDKENVKVADFEFSLLFDRIENENSKTGRFCGTIYYVAPEIICQDLFSYSADVWSLGITVYEMATQETPFRNMNYEQIIESISELKQIEYNLPDTSLYYHNLKTIIDKMLKVNLEERSGASKLFEEINVYLPKSLYQY